MEYIQETALSIFISLFFLPYRLPPFPPLILNGVILQKQTTAVARLSVDLPLPFLFFFMNKMHNPTWGVNIAR